MKWIDKVRSNSTLTGRIKQTQWIFYDLIIYGTE